MSCIAKNKGATQYIYMVKKEKKIMESHSCQNNKSLSNCNRSKHIITQPVKIALFHQKWNKEEHFSFGTKSFCNNLKT